MRFMKIINSEGVVKVVEGVFRACSGKVVRTFVGLNLNPAGYGINESLPVAFQCSPRDDIPHSAVLLITAPAGFEFKQGDEGNAILANHPMSADLSLAPMAFGQKANEVRFVFGSPFAADATG